MEKWSFINNGIYKRLNEELIKIDFLNEVVNDIKHNNKKNLKNQKMKLKIYF